MHPVASLYQVVCIEQSSGPVGIGCTTDLARLNEYAATQGHTVVALSRPTWASEAMGCLEALLLAPSVCAPNAPESRRVPIAQVLRPGGPLPAETSDPAGTVVRPVATGPSALGSRALRVALRLLGLRDGPVSPITPLASLAAAVRAYQSSLSVVPTAPVTLNSPHRQSGAVESAEAVASALAGRVLLRTETAKCLSANRPEIPTGDLAHTLDFAVNLGLLRRQPAVLRGRHGGFSCSRCGSSTLSAEFCPWCRRPDCIVCSDCRDMGESRACLEVYSCPGDGRLPSAEDPRCDGAGVPPLTFAYDLTAPQGSASADLRAFVAARPGEGEDKCLVWAVCGAGKTEVAFGAVHEALLAGKRVLFAIPRRDVVLELAPRIRESFPWARISVLHGGADEPYARGQIVLATTHQVLRSCSDFGLVVVDEADAFPYIGNRMLLYAMERAMAPESRLVYMTATPDRLMLREAESGMARLVTIPARHHGRPLPVPALAEARLDAVGRGCIPALPAAALGFATQALAAGHPLFVFVPLVKHAEAYARALQAALPGYAVAPCHSKDPGRQAKREAMQRGELQAVVSTSVLERGITVACCDAMVLHADYEAVLDERGLVQMAGRVGRTTACPTGSVLFVGERISESMRRARDQIVRMNHEAAQRGFLREDSA